MLGIPRLPHLTLTYPVMVTFDGVLMTSDPLLGKAGSQLLFCDARRTCCILEVGGAGAILGCISQV